MQIIVIAFILSLCIEMLQLISKTGMYEWDDMLHGCIGATLGYEVRLKLDRLGKR